MTNTCRIALLAALSMWATLASAKDANAVVDLTVRHPDLNGDGGEVQLFEGSSRKSGRRNIVGRGDVAEASFSATGWAALHTYAPFVYVDGDGPLQTNASANTWAGDVLTFHVVGASPETVTRITLGVKLSGTISLTLGIASGYAGVDYCVGMNDTKPCGDPPPEVVALLNLPPPSGVVQGSAGGVGHSLGPDSFDDRMKPTIDIVGPDAVVPLWYLTQTRATSDPWVNCISVDTQASVRWTIKLPDGVSCTSRSGHAFKGQCPAASR